VSFTKVKLRLINYGKWDYEVRKEKKEEMMRKWNVTTQ
jgi:hypothetical protein